MLSAWRRRSPCSSISALSFRRRTTARRTEQTFSGSYDALSTSTRPLSLRRAGVRVPPPRAGLNSGRTSPSSRVSDEVPVTAAGSIPIEEKSSQCPAPPLRTTSGDPRRGIGAEHPDRLSAAPEGGKGRLDRRIAGRSFEVHEEDVAAEALLERPRLDLAEVDAPLGELSQHLDQHARRIGKAPEDDRRLGSGAVLRGGWSRCRASEPYEAGFVLGMVL